MKNAVRHNSFTPGNDPLPKAAAAYSFYQRGGIHLLHLCQITTIWHKSLTWT